MKIAGKIVVKLRAPRFEIATSLRCICEYSDHSTVSVVSLCSVSSLTPS